jgi:multiple sugar transport system substrate-binding protein
MLPSNFQVRISLFLLLCFCLTGCGRQGSADTISFMVFGEPAELAAYESLVESFEAAHPDIEVELRHVPGQSEYRQKLATDFASGAPPDIFLLNYRRFGRFASEGGLEALDAYLERSTVIERADFFPTTIESFFLDDHLWCIPQNVSSLVVYYNRSLFDAAGLAYPGEDWTWEDLRQLARALTQDLDGDGQIDQYGLGIAPNLQRLAPFVWQNGGELVDDLENPTRLALDSPVALEAFRWFVGLQVREHVVPDAVAEAAESIESRFLNGRLGMILNSRRAVPTYRTIEDFVWDVAALPRGPRGAAGILHSDGFCMAAQAKNKEAAWSFIEYANSAKGQTLLAASGRTVPSRHDVAESSAFLDPNLPPANSRVWIDTMPILRGVPIMSTWAGIEETASREIERAFYGQASVEEAAAAAQFLAQPYFEQASQGR